MRWFLTLLLLLGACGPAEPTGPEAYARAEKLRPADDHLAALYETSCRQCHIKAESGAPPTGNRAAWRARLAKGKEKLLADALQGLNGMPAGGQCAACNENDMKALIDFLAGEGPAREVSS